MGSGYVKTSDTRIQLLSSLDSYKSGDTFAVFYKTIYMLAGLSMNKEPQIPINYLKDKSLIDTIRVRLFNEDGNIVQELNKIIEADIVEQCIKHLLYYHQLLVTTNIWCLSLDNILY
jgi:hypothetical protein